MIYAIDFDGTIVDPEYPGIGPLRPGAVRAIQEIKARGHMVIIWTCREGQRLEDMKALLMASNIPYDAINENSRKMIDIFGNNSRKVYADCYIDDRNFASWTWAEVMEKVRA